MVEVEQEQGNVALFGHGAGDELLPRNDQRAAVQKARQRIGVGQIARALFGSVRLRESRG